LSTIVAIASGPYFAACGVLVVTGTAKVRQPQATATALRAATGGGGARAARALGSIEVALGTLGALIGGGVALLVAALYGAFVAVALHLRRRAPGTPCGCLGDKSATVGVAHVAVSTGAAVVAVGYGVGLGGGIFSVSSDQPIAGLPYLGLVGCCIAVVTLFLTVASEERSWLH
jgi:hypothetical protein